MQWMGGHVQATAGIKGIGDLFGKAIKGAMTKESAVKPEYVGDGYLVLEPTYKYIILVDVEEWGSSGMTIEDRHIPRLRRQSQKQTDRPQEYFLRCPRR